MSDTHKYWWFRLGSALRWYRAALTRYDVHSPLLSDFVREVFHDDRKYHAFQLIDGVRNYWKGQRTPVRLRSLGAPSRTTRKSIRSAADLVGSNAIGSGSGKFLFRLALWLKPRQIIEFGTNAGISTLYLHLADTSIPLQTVEGNPEVGRLATETFKRAGVTPSLVASTSLFTEWISRQTDRAPDRLLFFLDGDHRYSPTLAYVDQLLKWANDQSVIVVADIHWSVGMERAWEELMAHPRVTASLDTYHFGLLFLRKELNGPHLKLIPTPYKFWRVGFF